MLVAVNYSTGIENAWTDVAAFVPKLLACLAILLIGYFIAKAIAKALGMALEKVGFNRAVERGGIRKALAKSNYDASDVLGKIVFYTLFLFVLTAAFDVFGQNSVSDMLTAIVAYLPKVIVAILVIVVAASIAAAVREVVQASIGGLNYGKALANGAGISILVIGAFAALNQLEIAPEIVNGLFYGLLAIVVGSAVIAIGGGGIQPMRAQWDKALQKVEQEAPNLKQEAQGSTERIAERAQEVRQQAQEIQQDEGQQEPAQSAQPQVDVREQPTQQMPQPQTTPGVNNRLGSSSSNQ